MRGNERGVMKVRTGIAPLDERTGGLESGGLYVVVGPPGPAKMVTALQFVHQGLRAGERCALLTTGDADTTLQVAEAWGFPMTGPWRDGQLQLVGFQEQFELRALRAVDPDEVLAELKDLLHEDVRRIGIDPASLFLSGPARTQLGTAFLNWGRRQPATVCATLSMEGSAPAAAPDWMLSSITGALAVEPRNRGLQQLTLLPAVPEPGTPLDSVSLELQPGAGLVRPTSFPTRRREDDRPRLNPDRLLLISLGDGPGDLKLWASGLFQADVVSKPFDAMNHLEPGADYGVVLIHAPRGSINEAIQACRAIRPLTRGGIVFVTDDGVRSNDRVSFLEAGADDALTGGLDFRELEIRVRQAARRGGQSPEDAEARPRQAPAPVRGGRVGVPDLIAHIRERRARNGAGLFSLLTLTSDIDGALEALEPHLLRQIRDEDGDMVSRADGGLLVLLAGARESQTEAFLRRFRSSLRGAISAPSFQVRVACHPSNTNAVEAMLEAVGGART